MFQETKRSAAPPDDQYPFSITSSSFGSQMPLFRDISELPRSVAPDFMSSSSLTSGPEVFRSATLTSNPDVYRSIEQPSAGGLFAESSWTAVSNTGTSSYLPPHGYGLKGLEMPQSFPTSESYGWSDPYSVQQYEKTKSIEDLRSPLIQSFPASNASTVNAVPPPLPDYVDPSYNFRSKSQATDLFQSVISTMKRVNVDVEARAEKFRIKCKSYPSGALLCFVVRIYRDVKKSESVVECQRRTGCVLRFAELYRTLKKQMDPSTRDNSLTVPTRKEFEMNQENAQETTQCLLLMAHSHFVDVKSKAVEALANLSGQDRTMQDILIKNGSVNLLLDCAKLEKVEDVHRPSLTALANLSDGRADVCRTIAEKSLQCLSDYTSTKNPQVVRECARVLTNIGHNLKDTMRDVECVSTAVKNLSRSSDPLALQCARELEDCFEGMS